MRHPEFRLHFKLLSSKEEVLTDITLGTLTPANNGETIDAVNASKVVLIKRADKVEGVFLVD